MGRFNGVAREGQWRSEPDPAMAGPGSSSPWGKHVYKVILMVLVALVLLHSASSQSHSDFVPPGQQKKEAPVDLLSQVQTFLLWGAGALVVYWLLSLLLGLVLAVLGRILWGLKLVLFLVGFVALVRSVPDPSTRALLLLALLTLYALLSRLSGTRASGAQLEAKVRGLERQVEELRWRQRRAAKGPRSVEEE